MNVLYNVIVHQVGHLPKVIPDARSAKHKIQNFLFGKMKGQTTCQDQESYRMTL